jgi:hypothetical protein
MRGPTPVGPGWGLRQMSKESVETSLGQQYCSTSTSKALSTASSMT